MKTTRYGYKLTTKIKRNPELLDKYGFTKYVYDPNDKGDIDNEEIKAKYGDILYAKALILKEDCSLVQYLKRSIEEIYTNMTTKERNENFAGLEFKEILTDDQQRDYEVVMNEELYKELTECELCIPTSSFGEWSLFINGPDRVEYYNTVILDECAKDIVSLMLQDKAIQKARIKDIK